jgi:CheY-like chemotaxis protein
MRILVVDDEPAVREAVERALRLDGHEVSLAADGQEALSALGSRQPDAVVLDLLMPRVDGLELCRRMRGGGDRTPVLMLTARDAVADRVAGLDAGADDYLVKPFALEELLARVRAPQRLTGRPPSIPLGGRPTRRSGDRCPGAPGRARPPSGLAPLYPALVPRACRRRRRCARSRASRSGRAAEPVRPGRCSKARWRTGHQPTRSSWRGRSGATRAPTRRS